MKATKRGPGRPVDAALRERRQEDILDTAAKVFAQQGYAETDVQLLADELQVGKGTIYRYFPSKEKLFLAAVDRGMRRLRAHVDAAAAEVADPLEQMARAIRAYLAFYRDHPEYCELFIQERATFRDRKKPTYFVHREANRGPWQERVRGLIAAKRLRPITVDRIMDVLGQLVYGTMFTNHLTGTHQPVEAQAEDLLDIIFYGILSDTERKRLRVE